MAQYMSPGITVNEYDFSQVITATSSTTGGICGTFQTGPSMQPTLITSEAELVEVFGKPLADRYTTFFTAANFLQYSNSLYVVRVLADTDSCAASANVGASPAPLQILNDDDYTENWLDKNLPSSSVKWASKYTGAKYNSLQLYWVSSPWQFSSWYNSFGRTLQMSWNFGVSNTNITFNANVAVMFTDNSGISPIVSLPYFYELNYTANSKPYILQLNIVPTVTYSGNLTTMTFNRNLMPYANNQSQFGGKMSGTVNCEIRWMWKPEIANPPSTSPFAKNNSVAYDELHLIIVDGFGKISGRPGTILEKFPNVSKLSDAKNEDGTSNYYVEVLKQKSKYVYALNKPFTQWGATSADMANTTFLTTLTYGTSFYNGFTTLTPTTTASDVIDGYNLFLNQELNVSLLMGGSGDVKTGQFDVLNRVSAIAAERQDCMAFLSPPLLSDVLSSKASTNSQIIFNLLQNFKDDLSGALNSYTVLDGAWKYQYDKYWNKYRYVPLNGDIAGLVARTEFERDSWWSPAGLSRGKIKGAIKLSWEPNKSERDQLYANAINPVITIRNEGITLYGDKTALSRPSAFDRINVRRLFITLEKAITDSAKYSLFEFNDEFTRAQFVSLVEPYLRDIQGRRGIYDFKVICDESNNTPLVIDQNRFIGSIYIKPTRSINFIELNFVATGSGVDFNTITGMDGI